MILSSLQHKYAELKSFFVFRVQIDGKHLQVCVFNWNDYDLRWPHHFSCLLRSSIAERVMLANVCLVYLIQVILFIFWKRIQGFNFGSF